MGLKINFLSALIWIMWFFVVSLFLIKLALTCFCDDNSYHFFECLLCARYCALRVIVYLILPTVPYSRYYYPQFTDEETDAKGSIVTFPWSQR